jgi:hypothetical protein
LLADANVSSGGWNNKFETPRRNYETLRRPETPSSDGLSFAAPATFTEKVVAG